MRRMTAGVVAGESRRRGFVWVGIAAAAVVGFLAGSTGLAMADALPDPAQEVAHDVLRVVQVDVPQGKEGKRGPCVAEAAKIKDKDAKKAAKDACPKGGDDESGDETGDETGTPGQGPPPADDPCRGRPPWAGPMSKEQREAAKESASRENCPQDEDDSGEGGGQAGPPAQDDPCRGRPPWAGPMSKEQREAAKESASRENCPQDEDDEDADEDADAARTLRTPPPQPSRRPRARRAARARRARRARRAPPCQPSRPRSTSRAPATDRPLADGL